MTGTILLLTLLALFAINTPIALSIGISAILALLVQGDFSLMMLAQRMYAGCDSFHLLAVLGA